MNLDEAAVGQLLRMEELILTMARALASKNAIAIMTMDGAVRLAIRYSSPSRRAEGYVWYPPPR
jgi:hypothetical protein